MCFTPWPTSPWKTWRAPAAFHLFDFGIKDGQFRLCSTTRLEDHPMNGNLWDERVFVCLHFLVAKCMVKCIGKYSIYGSHIIYGYTSAGRKFAPVEGLSHDLVCNGSIYHVHFAWQVWHGQLSPRFKFNKLKSFSGVEIDQNHVKSFSGVEIDQNHVKSFSGVEIDQNHVDKRILGGKGFAVRLLKRHNFCPASVYI